jgi:hypothetical protein
MEEDLEAGGERVVLASYHTRPYQQVLAFIKELLSIVIREIFI